MAQFRVLQIHQLPVGAKQVVKAGETEILLVHSDTGIVAVQSKCPHAGGPLEQGAVCNNRLVCPWHMGTFALPGGELLEAPAMEPLKTFSVEVHDGEIFVDDQPTAPEATQAAAIGSDKVFLIVGAGAAGIMAASTLREKQFSGRIVVVDPMQDEPVDRTQLSKDGLAGKIPLVKIGIDTLSKANVERVHASLTEFSAAGHEAVFSNGQTMYFDRALIATGGTPKRLEIPGGELVHTIRHVEDVRKIHNALESRREVVILGGSFIALETASALIEKGHQVTVAAKELLPFAKQFGDRTATALKQLHESNGTRFRLGVEVLAISATEVQIREEGKQESLRSDVVIAGVGVTPALEFRHDLPLAEDGGIRVDGSLRAAADTWVAGDIARVTGSRIEHWRVAQQHGRIAALAMMGEKADYEGVPFFWTYHFGKRIDYLGSSADWDEIVFEGDPAEMKFMAFYLKHRQGEEIVEAILSCERESETAMLAELMRSPITFAEAQKQVRLPR